MKLMKLEEEKGTTFYMFQQLALPNDSRINIINHTDNYDFCRSGFQEYQFRY